MSAALGEEPFRLLRLCTVNFLPLFGSRFQRHERGSSRVHFLDTLVPRELVHKGTERI